MMRHLLTDPAFPDLVAAAAADAESELRANRSARDRREQRVDNLDAYLTLLGKMEMAATRLW